MNRSTRWVDFVVRSRRLNASQVGGERQAAEPHGGCVQQQGRNVLMWLDEQQLDAKFIVHDRDTKFSFAFDRLLFAAGVRRVRTPRLAPDANAYAEAWIGSLKRECLNHFLCFGLAHLDHILQTFARFYNEQRPHQGIGNRTIPEAAADAMPAEESAALLTTVRSASIDAEVGRIRCTRLLGGLLRHYERDAA